jgi:gluconolactonase
MSVEVLRPELAALIDPAAEVLRLATGFTFTEGPVWHPQEHHLLFSDMPADVRRRFSARGIEEVMRPSHKANGLTYDADLRLIACEHATSSLVRFTADGRREVLASRFEGRELNSPNDVVVRSDGSIWFTDPWYGRMPVYGVERPRQLGWQGVFRLPPGGAAPELVVDRWAFEMPNGLCFAPDERRLYVNDTARALVRVFEVAPDGRLDGGRLLASGLVSETRPGVPDGMKCDAQGHVWVTGPGGVWVLDPDGRHLGTVRVPELVANLAWGGVDGRTLFMTATTSLYAVATRIGPSEEPFRRRHGGTGPAAATGATAAAAAGLDLEPRRCALLIQDLQNDVIAPGGAFAASGAPAHAAAQGIVGNVRRLAEAARAAGVPVIHVWFVVEPGAPGLTLNAPLFTGLVAAGALVRGSWGAAPVPGLEPQPGDLVVAKMRMSAWEGTTLETILKATGRDTIVDTGAWTNMSIEHTARTGADKGYRVIVPEDACSTMSADWHRASIDYAMRQVATVTTTAAVIASWQARIDGPVRSAGGGHS